MRWPKAGGGFPGGSDKDPLVAVLTVIALVLELVALISREADAQTASLAAWVLRTWLDLRV
jgi:hypothetical protein